MQQGEGRTGAAASARQGRRDAAENRARILAAARRLFAAQGTTATSMNQVAQTAQVGPGTLYRHFAHKGALCQALLADDIAAFQRRIDAFLDGPDAPPSPLACLELVLDELIAVIEEHIPMFTAILEASAGANRLDVFHGTFYRWLHGRIAGLLGAAVAHGEAAPLDVEFTADAFFAAIAPPLFAFQLNERGFSRERVAAGMRRLFIDALRTATPAG
jgi:AcrR family transcriptional regulator